MEYCMVSSEKGLIVPWARLKTLETVFKREEDHWVKSLLSVEEENIGLPSIGR